MLGLERILTQGSRVHRLRIDSWEVIEKEYFGHQNFGHLMQRADSLEKTLVLEKIEGKRTRGRQRMR